MFEDILGQQQPEKPLSKCLVRYSGFEKCQYYHPDENDHSVYPRCEFYGALSESCYLDRYDI